MNTADLTLTLGPRSAESASGSGSAGAAPHASSDLLGADFRDTLEASELASVNDAESGSAPEGPTPTGRRGGKVLPPDIAEEIDRLGAVETIEGLEAVPLPLQQIAPNKRGEPSLRGDGAVRLDTVRKGPLEWGVSPGKFWLGSAPPRLEKESALTPAADHARPAQAANVLSVSPFRALEVPIGEDLIEGLQGTFQALRAPTDAANPGRSVTTESPGAWMQHLVEFAAGLRASHGGTSAPGVSPTPLLGAGGDDAGGASALFNTAPSAGGDISPGGRVQLPINTPFGQPGWADEVGGRVVWAIRSHVQSAQLHIDPPELGPVEIRIALGKDHTQVLFLTHHTAVRDAIEAGAHRLRDVLGDAGLLNVSVDVGQSRSNASEGGFSDPFAFRHEAAVDEGAGAGVRSGSEEHASSIDLPVGLIDLYA